MVRARLFCQVGKLKGERFEFDREATIGRHPDNTIVLMAASLSSRHARIVYHEGAGCFQLEDLNSLNGTRLDGHRVTAPEPLGHLHVITFAGKHDFIFQDLERCAARHPPVAGVRSALPPPVFAAADRPRDKTVIETDPAALPASFLVAPAGSDRPREEHTRHEVLPIPLPAGLARPPERPPEEKTTLEKLPPVVPAALVRPGGETPDPGSTGGEPVMETADNLNDAMELLLSRPPSGAGQAGEAPDDAVFFLEFLVDGVAERVVLAEGANLVGRDPSARVRPENPDISRRHATLTVTAERVTLRDEGSRNHTFLDGEQIEGEVELRPGAQLRFGSAKALLVAGGRLQKGGR